jgi:3-hydroxybutyryl-CoA dehydrogenase
MDTIGIIGAGQMGAGVAQVAAASGYRVVLVDQDLAIAEKARDGIGKRLARLVDKEQLESADADAALARIRPSADYAPLAEAGLIIEAATEREAIKQVIFEAAGKVLGAEAISRATRARSRSPRWLPAPPIPRDSSGCISSTRCR